MLKKLLKYDMQYTAKTWWVLAVAFLVACLVGGCLYGTGIAYSETFAFLSVMSKVFSVLLLFTTLSAFLIVTVILLCIRFYKNLYTDEGYLTFTLPVSRWDILISKTLSSVFWLFVSLVVSAVGLLIYGGTLEVLGSSSVIEELASSVSTYFQGITGTRMLWTVGNIGIGLFCLLGYLLMMVGFAELCISVGCMVAHKHKILASIGIYYGSGCVLNFILRLFTLFLSGNFFGNFYQAVAYSFGNNGDLIFVFLLLMIVFVLTTAVAAVFHILTHMIMENRLNLA